VIEFPYGDFEGTWSWCELDAASRLGCDVQVTRCFAPRRVTDLFGTWWAMAQTGRELKGEAANMAKAIANTTWGQFAMRAGEATDVWWADDKGNEPFATTKPAVTLPHERLIHVAAEITSRVRVATLEAIANAPDFVLHIDTDGYIMSTKHGREPKNLGPDYGDWRKVHDIDLIEIKAPQVYRWRGHGSSEWNVVASGLTPRAAEHFFADRGRRVSTKVSYRSAFDVCIPSFAAHETARRAAAVADVSRYVS
jgi:hypothetical protein